MQFTESAASFAKLCVWLCDFCGFAWPSGLNRKGRKGSRKVRKANFTAQKRDR